jgi:hypothetical protein
MRSSFKYRSLLRVCGLLLLGALASGALGQKVNLTLSPNPAVLNWSGTPGQFTSPNINFTVQSNSTNWSIMVVADNMVGPDGPIPSQAINLIPNPANNLPPGVFFLDHPVHPTQMTLIASGPRLPNTTIGRFKISADIPPLTRPGVVSGMLRFMLNNGARSDRDLVLLPFSFNVTPYTIVTLGGTALSFSAPQPGTYVSQNVLPMTVQTNVPAGANVSFNLGQLTQGNILFPKPQTAVAYSTTSAGALSAAASAPFGQGATSPYSFVSPYGIQNYFVAGKVRTTLTDQPGAYSGTLMVTVTGL